MHQFSEAQNGKLIRHAHTNNLIDGEKKMGTTDPLPEQFSSKIPDKHYTKWQQFLDNSQ